MLNVNSEMTRSDVIINEINPREGTPGLSSQCVDLMYALLCVEQAFIEDKVKHSEGYLRRLAQKTYQSAYSGLVATLGDKAIGFMVTDEKDPRHIMALFVDPAYRNTGIATEMILRHKLNYEADAITVNVYALNTLAMPLYEKLGFSFEPVPGYVDIKKGTLRPH